MGQKIVDARVRTKRDTSANWENNNPVLLDGEEIIVDTNAGEVRKKIGDGVKTYTELPFADEKVRSLIDERVKKTEIGSPNGVAALDAEGKVPSEQLPALTGGLELGETADTAYAGDKGKANADAIAKLKTDKSDTAHTHTAGQLTDVICGWTSVPGKTNSFSYVTVSFGRTYSRIPIVLSESDTTVLSSVVKAQWANAVTKTGFDFNVYRTNTTPTIGRWIAIDANRA